MLPDSGPSEIRRYLTDSRRIAAVAHERSGVADLRDETYELGRNLLPEMPAFGFIEAREALLNRLAPDVHPNVWELHVVHTGRLEFFVAGQPWSVGAGQALLIKPGELHWGRDRLLPPGSWWRLHFALDDRRRLCGLNATESDDLRRRLGGLPARLFPVTRPVQSVLAQLLAEHRRPQPDSRLLAQALTLELLLDLCRAAAVDPAQPAQLPATVRAALEVMTARLADGPTVAAIAAAVHVSPRQLHRLFVATVGFSPLEWLTRLRIGEAQRLLSTTALSVTTVAAHLGFASAAHFSAVFRRQTGQPPRAWRAGHVPLA